MMKKIVILLSVILIFFLACNRDFSSCLQNDSFRPASTLEKKMVSSSNAFGFKIFREIAKTDIDSNIFISPLSISFALGMAYNGAEGATQQAMHEVLEYGDMSLPEINQTYQSLISLLTTLDPLVEFDIANSAWPRLGFQVQESFMEVLKEYFQAEIQELDFSDPQAVAIINNWVKTNTQGKIEEIIKRIPPAVVLYLINALYFKGDWTYQFDPENTIESDFTCYNDSIITCDMMRQTINADYLTTESFQALDLPYGEGNFSMIIILPNQGTQLEDIVVQMTPENWTLWTKNFSEQEVTVRMPKFELSYGIELKEVLTALGMGIAFAPGADFCKINCGIYISRVIHKTFIQVDEEGTEAAAVTAVEFLKGSAEGIYMILNRPFIYVIWDHVTDNLLFMGILAHPNA